VIHRSIAPDGSSLLVLEKGIAEESYYYAGEHAKQSEPSSRHAGILG
jgi:hypothetical protein